MVFEQLGVTNGKATDVYIAVFRPHEAEVSAYSRREHDWDITVPFFLGLRLSKTKQYKLALPSPSMDVYSIPAAAPLMRKQKSS